MKKRILLLTGSPGVGKTSVLMKTVEFLKARGFRVGGMISREARSHDTRVGFEILDISSGKCGWLAHVNRRTGPRVGKYCVNVEDLESLGVTAITKAVENSDVVVIDEIGPMEMFSEKFKDAVRKAVEGETLVLGIIHRKAKNRLISSLKGREDTRLYVVTYENRDGLEEVIAREAIEFLGNH